MAGVAGNDLIDGGAGNDTLFGGSGADALYGGPGIDVFVFYAADFETGVYDVIKDMNIGNDADWFATSGIDPSAIWALDYQNGVVVTLASLGYGMQGGGVFIENFTAAQFWNQLLVQ